LPYSSLLQRIRAWLRVKGRNIDGVFFTLRRVTGIILVSFLIIHLVDISLLVQGDEAYDAFIRNFLTPQALFLEALILLSLIYHGVTGIYVAILGSGLLLKKRRELSTLLIITSLLVFVLGLFLLLNKVS